MQIKDSFKSMGARVRLVEALPWESSGLPGGASVVIDIRNDGAGEYFKLTRNRYANLTVLDTRTDDRHLLLSAQYGDAQSVDAKRFTFLCGRDERHWFVAAIPEKANATDVQSAKDALKPKPVWDALRQYNVPSDQRDRRRNAAFVRQGEWFFIPRPTLKVAKVSILHNEPIRRGAGKPHLCQFLHRIGGQRVFVCDLYPDGVTPEERSELPREERMRPDWREMARGAHAYVKGNIRHPDHKTIWLSGWHEVVMNTEVEAEAMRHMAFLD